MALVKLSGTISDISGKVGGIIFANSAAGLTVRSFTSPVNPNTLRQNNQRIIINDLQQQWKLLTQSQRDCWKQWIKLFPIKQNNFNGLPINAQQAFIKINAPFSLYGLAIIKDPVFIPNLRASITYNLFIFGAFVNLISSRILNAGAEFIEILMTYPLPLTRNNPGSIYKAIIFPTTSSGIMFLGVPYTDIFGRFPVMGEKVFFKVRTIDLQTGLSTPFQYGVAIFA